jgi:uncharacterized LabA/DUF88 family protein
LLPTVLRDWWGFYFPGGAVSTTTEGPQGAEAQEPTRAIVFIDYQNIHLTGRDTFAPAGLPAHECLIHPLYFANQVLGTRQHRLVTKALADPEASTPPPVTLEKVVVYRGGPSNKEQPSMYRRTQAQKSEWTRDRRVEVTYRTLRYHWENGHRIAQEKGIDVLVALALVRAADRGDAPLLILASHDTDLEPALSAALENPQAVIETAGWDRCKRLRVPGTSIRHTSLDGGAFVRSRDRRDYT